MSSGSQAKYLTMTLDEIKALPVETAAQHDAACFLWVTVPILPWGFDVLDAWGFKYKTAIFWHKAGRLGMGFWFRGQVEVCLLGIRGNVTAFRCQRENIIIEKPNRHSTKPEQFWNLVADALPFNYVNRIELFSRHERPGWDAWGLDLMADKSV